MKNPLTHVKKLFAAADVDTIDAELSELQEKRRAEALRYDNALRERGNLVLAAEAGDKAAAVELDKLVLGIAASKKRLANLDAAIKEAGDRKGEAANRATQRQVQDRVRRLDAVMNDRLDLMDEAEKLMRSLADVLDKADGCQATMEILRRELSNGHAPSIAAGELREAARQERLIQIATDIGLNRHFRIHTINLDRNAPKTLREKEALAQRQYEINESEALKYAGIAPRELEPFHGSDRVPEGQEG